MPDAPRSAAIIRYDVQAWAIKQGKSQLTQAQKGACMKYLCEAWPDAGIRHQCYGWLFQYSGESLTVKSSHDLADQEIDALRHWIDAQPIGDVWFAGPRFYREAAFIKAEAVKAFGELAGQVDLFDQFPTLNAAIQEGGKVAEIEITPQPEPTSPRQWTIDDL